VLDELSRYLAAHPGDSLVRGFKAYAHLACKEPRKAVAELRIILDKPPENLDALNTLAWIEATHSDSTLRNAKEAVELAEKSAALRPNDAQTFDTLAAAYAEGGRFKEAVETAKKARQAAEKTKNAALISEIDARLKLFEAGKPFRDQTMPK
jgi:tetratricopeptide (TPR) repeat protein